MKSLNSQIVEHSLESFAIRIAEQDKVITNLQLRLTRLEAQVTGHLIQTGEY